MGRQKKNYIALTIRISQEIYDEIERISDINGLYKTQNITRMIELGIKVEGHILEYLNTAFKKAAAEVIQDNLPAVMESVKNPQDPSSPIAKNQ